MKKTLFFLTLSLAMVLLVLAWLLVSDMGHTRKVTDTSVERGKHVYMSSDGQDHGSAPMNLGTLSTASSQKQTLGNTLQSEGETKSAAGYKVYKDPVTGKFGVPPPDAKPLQLSKELQQALSTSSEGLVQIQSPVPGGGIVVRLNGRFQSAMVAAADAEGNVSVPCLPAVSAPTGSKHRKDIITSKQEKE